MNESGGFSRFPTLALGRVSSEMRKERVSFEFKVDARHYGHVLR